MDDLRLISADELKEFGERIGLKPSTGECSDTQTETGAGAGPAALAPEGPGTHKKVVLGLLSYDGTMYCRCMMSIIQDFFALSREGWEIDCLLRDGDSMVARGRSFIASQFLEHPRLKNATDLVFVDCDLSWSDQSLVRLLNHTTGPDGQPVGVVGGCYPFKRDHAAFPMRWGAREPDVPAPLWEVDAVTPGFMRITRAALELVAGRSPWLEYHEHLAGKDQKTWMFFDNLQRRTGVFDEGYVFCEHWRTVGGKVWMDPDCNITHIGTKSFNHGTFRQHWEKKGLEVERLQAENPDVDPDKIVEAVVREIPINEVDNQHSDSGPTWASSSNDQGDVPQHSAAFYDSDDLGGRGRPGDMRYAQDDAVRAGPPCFDQTPGRFPGGEVRQGTNGGAG